MNHDKESPGSGREFGMKAGRTPEDEVGEGPSWDFRDEQKHQDEGDGGTCKQRQSGLRSRETDRSLRTGLRIQRLEGGRNQERGKERAKSGRQAGPEVMEKVGCPEAATGLKL